MATVDNSNECSDSFSIFFDGLFFVTAGRTCDSGLEGPFPAHLCDKAERGDGEEGPER